MGSLMAGWDSPVLMNPDSVQLERNRSLTREEIATFWKLKKKFNGEDHDSCDDEKLLSPSSSSTSSHKERSNQTSNLWKTNSAPPVEIKFGDWWTRSNWAFLNETPREEIDDHAHKYAPQFDVTKISTK